MHDRPHGGTGDDSRRSVERCWWFTPESDKRAFFDLTQPTGLRPEDYPHIAFGAVPRKTIRCFPDKLPIGIEKDDTSRFVFLYLVNRHVPVAAAESATYRAAQARVALEDRESKVTRPAGWMRTFTPSAYAKINPRMNGSYLQAVYGRFWQGQLPSQAPIN